jgi:hypothetical protein
VTLDLGSAGEFALVTFDALVLFNTFFVLDIDLTEVFDFVSDLDAEELVARFDNPNR